MKKLGLITILALGFLFASHAGWADKGGIPNDPHGKHDTTATDMTLLGVAAASLLGAGAYAVRRKKS